MLKLNFIKNDLKKANFTKKKPPKGLFENKSVKSLETSKKLKNTTSKNSKLKRDFMGWGGVGPGRSNQRPTRPDCIPVPVPVPVPVPERE